jgi:ADP-ribose pyrophosphatase YjhB (NUDIX family)
MYNIFVNKKILRIDDKVDPNFELKVDYAGIKQLKNLIVNLEHSKIDSVLLLSEHPENVLNDFGEIAEIRVASGGKVENNRGDILFILRDGVWDLPKGFVEEGESLEQGAIREVEEETGISKLKIIDKLNTTYHIYRYRGILVLKVSHWYNMKTSFQGNFIPQAEEGITDVKWFNNDEIVQVLTNTWENIKLLF